MKKIIKNILITIIALLIVNSKQVYATNSNQIYYTSHFGVNMTEEEYNLFKTKFDDFTIENMDSRLFESLKEDLNNVDIIDTKVKYIKTITYKDELNNYFHSEVELTEDEYNNFVAEKSRSSCSDGVACWETNAKKLFMRVYVDTSQGDYQFVMNNLWKSIPSVKSYDVMGFRWTSTSNEFIRTNYSGVQVYNNNQYIQYSMGGTNSKTASNGLGISMNIVDSASTYLSNTIIMYAGFSMNTVVTVYGTYQHATSDLSLANSKSYSFSSSGLGKVLYYSNTNIRNKYDNMQCIKYTFSPDVFIPGPVVI